MQYLARQPILDTHRRLSAFELLFRDSFENRCPDGDADLASKKTMDTAMLMGVETLADGYPIFLNCTETLVIEKFPTLFAPTLTVIEILESASPTPQLVQACTDLKRAGYRIALDDFTEQPGYEPLIELADIFKIDLRLTRMEDWPALARKFLNGRRQLLAEKVETEAEFQAAKKLGFTLFQGYLFSKPHVIATASVDSLATTQVRILRALASSQLNFPEVEAIVKSEPALSYRLLRLLNSSAFYFQDEIRSIPQALSLLGEIEIRKWMLLVCAVTAGVSTTRKYLLSAALVRARFAELLAPSMGVSSASTFLVGILSLMDAILDWPSGTVARQLAVSGEIRDALLGQPGTLSDCLELIEHYEAGNWGRCDLISRRWKIQASLLSESYLDALRWAKTLTDA